MMDGDFLKTWSGIVSTLISIATVVWVALTSGAKKTAGDLKEFQKQDTLDKKELVEAISAMNAKIRLLENEMAHLPSKETTHEIERVLERILGRLDTMDERIKPIAATMHRFQEYLLEPPQK